MTRRRRRDEQRRSRQPTSRTAERGDAMMQRRVGIYPGTFDPITNGHTDIIRRAPHARRPAGHRRRPQRRQGAAVLDRRAGRDRARRDRAISKTAAPSAIEVRAFDTLLMHFAESVGAERHHPRPARRVGFRVRIPDGRHERAAQPEDRDRVPDGLRPLPVHLVALRQGDRRAGRRRLAFRQPARRRAPARPLRLGSGKPAPPAIAAG